MSGGGGNSRLEGGMEAQWPLINRCGRKHVIHEIRSGGRRTGEAEFGWPHAPLNSNFWQKRCLPMGRPSHLFTLPHSAIIRAVSRRRWWIRSSDLGCESRYDEWIPRGVVSAPLRSQVSKATMGSKPARTNNLSERMAISCHKPTPNFVLGH